MRRLIAAVLLLGLWLIPSSLNAQTSTQTKPNSLYQVKKIYIGDLGSSDEATRFVMLLEDELAERGFTVVGKPAEADALLVGALSVTSPTVGIYGGWPDVAVTVRLNTQGGERLWSVNLPKPRSPFSIRVRGGFKYKEIVEYRAEELAKELRGDWEKSARAAGIKVSK
jgi:hypothetical protein